MVFMAVVLSDLIGLLWIKTSYSSKAVANFNFILFPIILRSLSLPGNMGAEHETYINCADIMISDEGETYTTTLTPPLQKRRPLYKSNKEVCYP